MKTKNQLPTKKRSLKDALEPWVALADKKFRKQLAKLKLPNLRTEEGYTQTGIVMGFAARGYPKTRPFGKEELQEEVRRRTGKTADVQQARHLASQWGVDIRSKQRGDPAPGGQNWPPNKDYWLATLEKPRKIWAKNKRAGDVPNPTFHQIKKQYNYQCATCGACEGKSHPKLGGITQLQKGHRDPHKSLAAKVKGGFNCIPQCSWCNRAGTDSLCYDENGRVVGLASPALAMTDNTSKATKQRILDALWEDGYRPKGWVKTKGKGNATPAQPVL